MRIRSLLGSSERFAGVFSELVVQCIVCLLVAGTFGLLTLLAGLSLSPSSHGPVLLLTATGSICAGALVFRALRSLPRRRPAWAAGAAVLVFLPLAYLLPPGPVYERLGAELDRLFATRLTLLGEERIGNFLCAGGCPSLIRHYDSRDEPRETYRLIVNELRDSGWRIRRPSHSATPASGDGTWATAQGWYPLQIVAHRDSGVLVANLDPHGERAGTEVHMSYLQLPRGGT